MKAPLTLRKPANWQDFESLCKKLWGEIWNCPEIQKNGRLGQEQFGVDIFGIPLNDNGYYGIQCKGKSEYSHSQFTEKEIEEEIEKAKKFKPVLKKYYLVTTAGNDSKIQEFIRRKNIENKANGLFEIHLFAWESIVDLIDENKHTHDWYVKSQNYKATKSVALTFKNGLTTFTCNPKFRQTKTYFMQKMFAGIDPFYANPFAVFAQQRNATNNLAFLRLNRTSINLSYVPIEIVILNTGLSPIEDYKVILNFEGEIKNLSDTNEKREYFDYQMFSKLISNTYLDEGSMSGTIVPQKSILVGDDILCSKEIFIKPSPKECDVIIKWKLISKDYKNEGELILNIVPNIEIKEETVFVKKSSEVRIEEGEIADYIEYKEEEKKQ